MGTTSKRRWANLENDYQGAGNRFLIKLVHQNVPQSRVQRKLLIVVVVRHNAKSSTTQEERLATSSNS